MVQELLRRTENSITSQPASRPASQTAVSDETWTIKEVAVPSSTDIRAAGPDAPHAPRTAGALCGGTGQKVARAGSPVPPPPHFSGEAASAASLFLQKFGARQSQGSDALLENSPAKLALEARMQGMLSPPSRQSSLNGAGPRRVRDLRAMRVQLLVSPHTPDRHHVVRATSSYQRFNAQCTGICAGPPNASLHTERRTC